MDYNKIVSLVWQASKFAQVDALDIKEKNAYDFVTQVDTNVSNFLKENLATLYPHVGFVTEEEDTHVTTDERFILDPIDGTTNLIYNYRQSAISLAYCKGGKVNFGVVFNPFSNEMFFAIAGKGAYLYNASAGIDALLAVGVENYQQNLLHVKNRDFAHSLVEFGAGSSCKAQAPTNFGIAQRMFEGCLDLRRICCTALSICYLAAGRIDGYFEMIIKPWDFAAGILILAESGGLSSTWEGAPLPLDRPTTICCATSAIHQQLLQTIKEVTNEKAN